MNVLQHLFLHMQVICLALVLLPRSSVSLSMSSSTSSEAAQLTRARLQQAFSSPSGKLTLSSEIFIPEPSNPTAILLQAPAITQLSTRIRVRAKANTAFLTADSLGSLQTFCKEQEEARGNFPGPVPVIYCSSSTEDDAIATLIEDMSEVAETGVSGVLVSINEGSEISSVDDISAGEETASWLKICKNALECGLQPVPEITVKDSTATTWKEDDMEALVGKISELMGEDPVSILLTINPTTTAATSSSETSSSEEKDDSDDDDDDDEESEPAVEALPLPAVSKALGKRVPIMVSVRAGAGAGRMGEETARIKASGFTGAVLRRECVPGFPNNPSIEFSADFWSACIGDLKSVKSKTFEFRSKNNMEQQLGTQWANYQNDVMDSGALGDMADSKPEGFDQESGDYQGF